MKIRAKIIEHLKKNMPVLKKKYKVDKLEIFGSYGTENATKRSDLDVLVEFYEPIDLFQFIELEEFLSQELNVKVDLVMKDTLKPRLKMRIVKEAVPV